MTVVPSADNVGRDCDPASGSRKWLPDHIDPCECDAHDGVCTVCGYKITVGPSGTEYGHARASNRSAGDEYRDCPHRPASCDPNKPQARSYRATDGSESA
jgi:hypothetical protein